MHQFNRSGEIADADAAIDGYRRALDQVRPASPERIDLLQNLAAGYRLRARPTGAVADLDQAVSLDEEILQLIPDRHPRAREVLTDLSSALRERSDVTGSLADADRAVVAAERAVAFGGEQADEAASPDALALLVKALLTRFEWTGDAADADRAVSYAEQAVDLAGDGADQLELAWRRTDLANALLARGQHTGSSIDNADALQLIRAVIAAVPPENPDYPDRLVNLTNLLLQSARRTDADDDEQPDPLDLLDEAVQVSGEAMRLTSQARRDWWIAGAAHVNALLARYRRTRASADLTASVTTQERVVAALPPDHPDRSGQLGNLGSAAVAIRSD